VRWGVFVHDPDGDMGYGLIIGAFKDAATAEAKADQIRAHESMHRALECIVLPIVAGAVSSRKIAGAVLYNDGVIE